MSNTATRPVPPGRRPPAETVRVRLPPRVKPPRPPSKLDAALISTIVFLAINICALAAFVLVCFYYFDSFRLYVNTAKDVVNYAVQQGTSVITRFGTDVGNDAVNLKNLFLQNVGFVHINPTATVVKLDDCKPGWHNDGLTCRKPIRCHMKHWWQPVCSGGQVRGRLNDGGCCDCGKFKRAGLCWTNCPEGYDPLVWPFSQVCLGRASQVENSQNAAAESSTLRIPLGCDTSDCPKEPNP